MSSITIWIINADDPASQRLEKILRREGWDVRRATDTNRFATVAEGKTAGIALLDLSALSRPFERAVAALKTQTPQLSLFLTSQAELSNKEIIDLLGAGIDDYLPPQLPAELICAKLKASLRRILPTLATSQNILKNPSGDIKIDVIARQIWVRRNAEGPWQNQSNFTNTEFNILSFFLKRAGDAIERPALICLLKGGKEDQLLPATVDKHVESLRKKLGPMGSRIKTIYGVGYAWREEK